MINVSGFSVEEMLRKKPEWVKGGSLSPLKTHFITEVIKRSRASNAVEVGVASGWGSAVILNALSQVGEDFCLTGIDARSEYYKDPSFKVGHAVKQTVPLLEDKYNLYLEQHVVDVSKKFSNLDFVFIDGDHNHPWPTLDFLGLLPFMKKKCWVVLDDINLCRRKGKLHRQRGAFYLYYLWNGKKISTDDEMPRVGAFELSSSIDFHLDDIVEVLYTPWERSVSGVYLYKILELIEAQFCIERFRQFETLFKYMNRCNEFEN